MWEALQSLIVGLLAPAGIWFGWFLQRRDKQEDRTHRRSEILREKAEQIYSEIEAVQERSSRAVFTALRDVHGMKDEDAKPFDIGMDRLKSLLMMYFPEAAPIIAEYDREIVGPINSHSERFAAVKLKTHLPIQDKLREVKQSALTCTDERNSIVIRFLAKTRAFMDSEVQKLF
jgi:hypothetical protein